MRPGDVELDRLMRQALQLHQGGRRAEAESLYRKLLAMKPSHPAALHFLGLLLHQTGRGAEALPFLDRSVRAEPRNPDFLNNLGVVLRDLGRIEASADVFRRALALKPDHGEASGNLGSALRRLGELKKAEEVYRAAVAVRPNDLKIRMGLAEILKETGRYDEAMQTLRSALEARPDDLEIVFALGATEMEAGRIADAEATFRRLLARDPANARAWMELSRVTNHLGDDSDIDAMQALYAKTQPGSEERMMLGYGLGKAIEDRKDYGRAFDYIRDSNAILRRRVNYDPAKTREQFETMKAVFDEGFFRDHRGSGLDDARPIFIFGMPRSGTTLAEQILVSHPAVIGAGEVDYLKRAIVAGFPPLESTPFPRNVLKSSDLSFRKAGQAYLDLLESRHPGAMHVTDKMLGNFMFVGFIRLMLPNATLVHCVRNAAATCLSIFKANFRQGHDYACDLEELADFHNLYADLMAHWNKVLPGAMYELRYEDVIADQEGQTRALIAHCGLEWDDACLAFHETDRPVRTASVVQVRQPLYGGSVDLWKRYGDRLDPLLKRLKPESAPAGS